MNYLILLNRKYPYKSGETFLENEIEEIAGAFDKIIIYPSDITPDDTLTRTVRSHGVETRVLEFTRPRIRQLYYALGAISYYHECTSHGVIRNAIEGYFLSAAHAQANRIISDLDQMSINEQDRVFVYSYWLYINAKVACLLKKYFEKRNINVVAVSRAHGFDIYEENRRFGYLPQRDELLDGLDHVYACSDNGAAYLKSKYPLYKAKISTAYLGTYDHGIGRHDKTSTLHVVSCSRLINSKRVHIIVDALATLKSSGLSIEWTHIGGGELFNEIRSEVKEKLSWMKVDLLGEVSNKEVYDYYMTHPADVFVNVSKSEGLPVSIMEAISFGIPVIATDVGGTGEIVINGISGVLVDADLKSEQLAVHITQFANMSKDTYARLRISSRRLWEEKYQAKKNYKEFGALVKGLMNN